MNTPISNDMADGHSSAPPKKSGPWLWIILGLVVLATPIACCAGCVYWGFGMAMAPFDAAVQALNDDAEIAGKLGVPIKKDAGFNVSNYNNGNGSAELEFNARGPNGSANVSGKMKLVAGTWSPDGLTVKFADGTTKTLQ